MKILLTICTLSMFIIMTTHAAYALPSDNFNDNLRNASLWNLLESNPSSVWCTETNQRLEIESAGYAPEDFAAYISNHWGFVTTSNFSFKVDFHNSITSGGVETYATIGLTLGKGYNFAVIEDNHVCVSACWESMHAPSVCFEYTYKLNGSGPDEFRLVRSSDDGTLYVSYDAGLDELYLSGTGYWKINASYTMSGLLKGQWDGYVITPLIFGSIKNMAVSSGTAYLDNFVIDSGTVILETDLNNDNKTNMLDFAQFANQWLRADCEESNNWCQGADFDKNSDVDLSDLAEITESWLAEI